VLSDAKRKTINAKILIKIISHVLLNCKSNFIALLNRDYYFLSLVFNKSYLHVQRKDLNIYIYIGQLCMHVMQHNIISPMINFFQLLL